MVISYYTSQILVAICSLDDGTVIIGRRRRCRRCRHSILATFVCAYLESPNLFLLTNCDLRAYTSVCGFRRGHSLFICGLFFFFLRETHARNLHINSVYTSTIHTQPTDKQHLPFLEYMRSSHSALCWCRRQIHSSSSYSFRSLICCCLTASSSVLQSHMYSKLILMGHQLRCSYCVILFIHLLLFWFCYTVCCHSAPESTSFFSLMSKAIEISHPNTSQPAISKLMHADSLTLRHRYHLLNTNYESIESLSSTQGKHFELGAATINIRILN